MTKENCTTVGRGQLTWDWNNEHVIQVGEFTLVKPAGAHNNIQVVGNPDKITIFSNGGTQDRTGQEYLIGDYGSDIQWVELCWTPALPPVVEPPALNDPVFQWVTGEPEIDCEGMTVTVVSHEEAAGWYWGGDGEQHLGGFHPTGNEITDVRPATAAECPAPPLDEEEDPEEVPEEIDCPEGTVPGWMDEEGNAQGCVNNQPTPGKPDTLEDVEETPSKTSTAQTEVAHPVTPVANELAVTGAGLEWTALIVGAVFVAAGLALYLKRSKR